MKTNSNEICTDAAAPGAAASAAALFLQRLQQWQQMSLDARLHNVLSPHLWRASVDDLEFKRTAAMQVVAAMSHLDSHVLPVLNAQFLPGVRRLAVG